MIRGEQKDSSVILEIIIQQFFYFGNPFVNESEIVSVKSENKKENRSFPLLLESFRMLGKLLRMRFVSVTVCIYS